MDDPRYARNDALALLLVQDRAVPASCCRCRRERGFRHLAYGLIVDDLADFRPGHRAAAEAGVRSPLAEAGLTKDDVRAGSRARVGLPTWDLPGVAVPVFPHSLRHAR